MIVRAAGSMIGVRASCGTVLVSGFAALSGVEDAPGNAGDESLRPRALGFETGVLSAGLLEAISYWRVAAVA